MDYSSEDIVRMGIVTLFKMIIVFLLLLTIVSIFVITLGWFLSLAFPQFTHFQASLIPLCLFCVSVILMGLISIWIRLGDLVTILEMPFMHEDDDDDEPWDDEELDYDEKPKAKVTPFRKNINTRFGKDDIEDDDIPF